MSPVTPAAAAALAHAQPAVQRDVRGRLALPAALLCDLDGTLIDTMPTLADLACDVMAEIHDMPRALSRDLYVATCGLPFAQQLEIICPGDARNALASRTFESRKPARCRSVRMAPDTQRALEALRERGTRIIVSSNNGQENVDAFVADSGFPFDLALGFGGGLAKGGPHVEAVSRKFGIGRDQMLFVGDSLHDGDIAARESLAFVGVAGTFSRQRFLLRFPGLPVVRRLGELPGLIA